ncbi:VPLPA-CTERM sorting domain-containing protein [Sulfurirhabdus autotrophica]|uniref:Putative secreted protein n=1 Tax=Sulfurirhabdus autotrophica TaxID=1706046 RepID=A0A4R3XRK4_9PROT|nr:VPLPA-CTERM sorting domain-containing protein [Sulfurirhabdus autotrophica]TCV79982.1 putative secreted protein [Sulfurirhabdus autotrophica]
MKKFVLTALLSLATIDASAALTQFTGSLYMLGANGSPAFVNAQCPSCNSSLGEIDKTLTTLLDISTGTANDIIGNHALLGAGYNWSITNLTFATNPDSTISASGNFLWTNSVGLTTSTYTQLSLPLGANGEIVALDGDLNNVKGNTLINGPFQGYSLYLEGTISPVPVPAAVWLLGSGLFGLIGLARRKAA